MKLRQILSESVRFGRREMNLVDKHQHRIRIGCEYEFSVDPDMFDGVEVDYDELRETDTYLDLHLKQINELIEKEKHENFYAYDFDVLISDVDEFIDVVERGSIDILFMDRIEELSQANVETIIEDSVMRQKFINFVNMCSELAQTDLIDRFHIMYNSVMDYMFSEDENPDDFLEDTFPLFAEISEIIDTRKLSPDHFGFIQRTRQGERIIDNYKLSDPTELMNFSKESLKEDLVEFFSERLSVFGWLNRVLNVIHDTVTDEDDVKDNMTLDELDVLDEVDEDAIFTEMHNMGLIPEGEPLEEDIPELIKDFVPATLMQYIDDIDREPDIHWGVEFITEPLSLDDTLYAMDRMFDFIDMYGKTTHETGLHMNISIDGMDFTEDRVDPVKLMLLVDDAFMDNQFSWRKYVDRMVAEFDNRDAVELAAINYKMRGIQGVEMYTKNNLRRKYSIEGKHQAISFTNLYYIRQTTNRIEFRYPGGDDYHEDIDKITWHLYRLCYMLLVTFDPSFKYDEYIKDLYRFWDRLSMKHFNRTFAELVRII